MEITVISSVPAKHLVHHGLIAEKDLRGLYLPCHFANTEVRNSGRHLGQRKENRAEKSPRGNTKEKERVFGEG